LWEKKDVGGGFFNEVRRRQNRKKVLDMAKKWLAVEGF